jgi:hypothetical protein
MESGGELSLLLLLLVDFLFLAGVLQVLTEFPSLAAWLVLVCLSSWSAGEIARFVSQSSISVLYGSALWLTAEEILQHLWRLISWEPTFVLLFRGIE